ncbi:MAG: NRDE family protein, partial [Myxococcota bacterium]
MCLVILAYRTHRGVSFLLGANRDEDRARPTEGMQLLEAGPPRLAGGRDLRAGGTWMSVAETGLVVALTNQPRRGSDGQGRSRGEIPILLGRGGSARAAQETARTFVPGVFNPCTVLVADDEQAFYLELIPGRPRRIEALEPGVHVLENRPWGIESPKERHVRSKLGELKAMNPDRALDRIRQTLSDPTTPVRPTS